ncbi:MAG: AbrB/MazE/SpoVT family DNA-binding domain-containing protein [Desulfurococcaceae archaeon]
MSGNGEDETRTSPEKAPSERRVDVSKLVSIIPPAEELAKKKQKITEKRVKIRYDDSLDKQKIRIPSELAKLIDVKEGDEVEVVVAGKQKFVGTATIFESNDSSTVYANSSELRARGVSDNSVVTVRRRRA